MSPHTLASKQQACAADLGTDQNLHGCPEHLQMMPVHHAGHELRLALGVVVVDIFIYTDGRWLAATHAKGQQDTVCRCSASSTAVLKLSVHQAIQEMEHRMHFRKRRGQNQ